MPDQSKTPQATPLTDALIEKLSIAVIEDEMTATEAAGQLGDHARQLETLCHALAGALGQAFDGKEDEPDLHGGKVCGEFSYWDLRKAQSALALYRALTSADERRGG